MLGGDTLNGGRSIAQKPKNEMLAKSILFNGRKAISSFSSF